MGSIKVSGREISEKPINFIQLSLLWFGLGQCVPFPTELSSPQCRAHKERIRRLETIYSLTRKNEQRGRRETEANRGSVRNRAWSESRASRLTARCAIQRVRLMLRKSFGFVGFFFLSACVKVNMYLGPEPVSAFRLPGDKHASEILCEHPALRALKHQLVHGVICMLILLLFSTHPTCICAKKITLLCRKVKCFLCALPFSIGFS